MKIAFILLVTHTVLFLFGYFVGSRNPFKKVVNDMAQSAEQLANRERK